MNVAWKASMAEAGVDMGALRELLLHSDRYIVYTPGWSDVLPPQTTSSWAKC